MAFFERLKVIENSFKSEVLSYIMFERFVIVLKGWYGNPCGSYLWNIFKINR